MSPRSIPKSPPVDTPLDAYRIAHALTDRPKRSGESWRVPCPAHGGDGPNLSLRNGNGGRLLTYCHSRGCSFKDIIAALRERGIVVGNFERSYTYPPDHKGFQKVVTRIDFVDQSGQTGKSFYSPGLQEGTPLLVLGDDGACPIVIVEGEAKADDLFEALYTDEGLRLPSHAVASYPHGSGSAHKADYSAVSGRKVLVWPDNDETGQDAGRKVWSACSSAGAAELWLVRGPAPDDLNVADKLAALDSAELLFERAKLGMSVRELYALEQPETLIENLLSAQDVTVLAAKPKAGKTNLVVGLLAENFNRRTWLGEPAKELRCVYLGEEPGFRFGKRLHDSQVSPDTARARFAYVDARSLSDCPTWQEKLERVRAYMDGMSERPNLLVIDTLGFWAGLSDFNDYATVSKEFKPVLDFAQGTSIAVLIVHHSRKGNGQDIDAISGSNALAANAGAVALLSKVDGNDTQRKLTVWSRDVGEYELIVNYNPVTHFYDKPEPMDTIPELNRDVLAILEDSAEGLTVKDVGESYREANGLEDGHGLGDSRIRTILRALERRALARQDGGKDASGKKVAAKWYVNQPQK